MRRRPTLARGAGSLHYTVGVRVKGTVEVPLWELKSGVFVLHIYVDADACPVKEETYRVATRYGIPVTLVAGSWMRIPSRPQLTLEVVDQEFDAADDWIVAHVGKGDVVITSDIPLASRCIERGAQVLSPTGRPFTASNIGDALATRNLLSELRGAGLDSSGPPPFDSRDRSRFLQALDQAIQAMRRLPSGPADT